MVGSGIDVDEARGTDVGVGRTTGSGSGEPQAIAKALIAMRRSRVLSIKDSVS
jgi:hypothetical protein